MVETARCQACDSEIAVDADQCPECGYDPRREGWVSSALVVLAAIPAGLVSLATVLVVPSVAASGAISMIGGMIVFSLSLVFLVLSGVAVYAVKEKHARSPTDEVSIFGQPLDRLRRR